ncbi:MAG TPA: NUDIX domain-containing protein [Ilumatobacteraceae bacterium]|nr:NUDIX domain-containing protein [Ilumatobacteraceae bacterium]
MTPALDVPAKPAATVLLLRDSADGLEVFMLRRTMSAAFARGMYVFPGGKVDEADGEGDLGYLVAAIRECYEEAGVLLAHDSDGNMVFDGHPALAQRHAVHAGTIGLLQLCAEHGLTPATGDLAWVSHWITPIGESDRRFDTRFFVAAAPHGQSSRHDDTETIASEWVRPHDALRRAAERELTMMPPTISNLEAIADYPTAADAMSWARRQQRPTAILPRLRRNAEGRLSGISLPWDEDYADLD